MNYFFIFLFILFQYNLNAENVYYIDRYTKITKKDLIKFKKYEKKYGISYRLLIAIAYSESNLNNKAIGIIAEKPFKRKKILYFLKDQNINYKISKYNKKNISIFPKTELESLKAILIADYFKANYDVGLMQINKYNIIERKLDKNKLILDIDYNIKYGSKILSECLNYNKGKLYQTLECYNKGTNRKKYNNSYANRVLKNYFKIIKILPKTL